MQIAVRMVKNSFTVLEGFVVVVVVVVVAVVRQPCYGHS